MANLYYWVDIYTEDGSSWKVDSFYSVVRSPEEPFLPMGWSLLPTGEAKNVRGYATLGDNPSDSEIESAVSTWKGDIDPEPPASLVGGESSESGSSS